MMKLTKRGTAFLAGIITGGVVGSVTALLFAPKSGKELRLDIKVGAEKVAEATVKAVDHVTETVYEASRQIEDRTVKIVSGAKQGMQNIVGGRKQICATNEQEETPQETSHN
ncbi:YtxH domain-containing protein [Paenibacillus endoradicis]|uniref:YtxH domain-containing protein n=1 Tax=Paenibacillus endoradicis TaxID=2972487 RepID=UPI002158D8ED|nr:YtxH domain-containing protein [Paenibacillus endoradicis]MCR8659093.1 YtxH domain-containing protein [Paenibacillus endoradicis]